MQLGKEGKVVIKQSLKAISLVLIIILILPFFQSIFIPQGGVVKAAEVDKKTVYKGLLITGFLIATIQLLTDDSTAEQGKDETGELGVDEDELYWLAKGVHAEARGEPFRGQVAVAAVILNRVESSQFPDSVYPVIFQKNQFTSVRDGQIYLEANDTAYRAAKTALQGEDPSQGALYFYNPQTARHQSWFQTRQVTVEIGNHVFAK